MSVKEIVLHELETMDENPLQDVASYLSFLKFRARHSTNVKLFDAAALASLYAEAEDEDRQLAEQGIVDYQAMLQAEDRMHLKLGAKRAEYLAPQSERKMGLRNNNW